MLNRTNRTLMADTLRLNLGTRSFALNLGDNMDLRTALRTDLPFQHGHAQTRTAGAEKPPTIAAASAKAKRAGVAEPRIAPRMPSPSEGRSALAMRPWVWSSVGVVGIRQRGSVAVGDARGRRSDGLDPTPYASCRSLATRRATAEG